MKGYILIRRGFLEEILDYLYELRCELNWSKDEIRCGYKDRFDKLCNDINKLESILIDV